MYNFLQYGLMIRDSVRMAAYQRALRAAVSPGCVVADVGAGTGIFSLLACSFGAARVYAIEPSGALGLGRRMAQQNGFADRIRFFDDAVRNVTLPERVDVLVSDMRGVVPLHGDHLSDLRDARERFLRPEGTIIPLRDEIVVAPVEAPELYALHDQPWRCGGLGVDQSLAAEVACNMVSSGRITAEQLIAAPQRWIGIDYASVRENRTAGELIFAAEREATLHGFSMWFRTELFAGIGFATGPEPGAAQIYKPMFLPLQRAVKLARGESVKLKIEFSAAGPAEVWSWMTRIGAEGASPRVHYEQSTFRADVLGRALAPKSASNYVPSRNRDGEILAFILEQMNGASDLATIARRVRQHFSDCGFTEEEALALVSRAATRFSR